MSDERHRALKRWERARQLAGVRGDPDLVGPPAYCRVRTASGGPDRIAVFLVALFAKDLTCVKACREPLPEGMRNAWWLVRGGIRWEEYLRGVVRHYGAGLPVPAQFQPLRKIGSGIVDQLASLPDAALPSVFAKMRDSGLLPALPALSRETCPQALPWEHIRACFQDFAGEEATGSPAETPAGIKDSPPR
ncbi:MAG TPA: hypothetical protein VJ385_18185 [Fibrobacteria bacterium]|nr:hypothetical protein [Fibrobacteria bacterium]